MRDKDLKRLILITNTLSGGGAERVMSVIANDFVDRGIEVVFLVLRESEKEYYLDPRVKIIYRDNEKTKDIFGQIKFIRYYMKKYSQSTFLSFFTHQNLYTIMASFGLNNRVVVSERNDPAFSIQGKIKKIARHCLYVCSFCDAIVFQTKGAAEYFSKKIRSKGKVIANPIKEGLPQNFEGNRKETIVSFGRLEPQKNYEMLLRAFTEFVKEYPEFSLILYGKGSQEKELMNLCNELNISEKVKFAGFCKNVHEEIIDAGVFVLPSNYEGLSNSMLEAMAIGLPVICTDCPPGGAAMFIEHKKNGMLVPVGDTKELVEALRFMVKNKQLAIQMGREACKVRDELKSTIICEQWEKVLFPEGKQQ